EPGPGMGTARRRGHLRFAAGGDTCPRQRVQGEPAARGKTTHVGATRPGRRFGNRYRAGHCLPDRTWLPVRYRSDARRRRWPIPGAVMPQTPFAAGSISLRLYPHNDLPAPEIVSIMREQGRRAAECGFDGVMVSEHHGGFAGYLPNPIQACNFLLDAMASGWAAPSPLLLPLRPAALVIEELAWLAAR